MAKACKCQGIVCAGPDLKFVKRIFKGEIITPGIRLKGDKVGDQKRIWVLKRLFKGAVHQFLKSVCDPEENIKNISRLIKELINEN